MSERTSILQAALIGLVVGASGACGDDDSGEGADGGTRPDSGGSGGGGGASAPTNSGCLDPAELDEVVAPTEFTDGSVVYRMALDGDDLFFSTIDTLYRVPAAGGEPEVVYTRDLAISVPFWVRADDVLVLEGASMLVSVPKAGGTPTALGALPHRISGSIDTRVDMIVEGDVAYAKSESGGLFDDDPLEITYFEIDLETVETREIAVNQIGKNSIMVKLGDALYTSSQDPEAVIPDAGIGTYSPDLLYRIPIASGEAEVVPLGDEPLAFNVIGADDAQLFLIAGAEADFALSGVYSADPEGGAPTQLFEAVVLFNSSFEHDRTASRNLIRDLGEVYSVPPGRTEAERLFCIGGEVHSMAADEAAVYLSLFDNQDRASIVRVPLD